MKNITIMGAGTMGNGIAQTFAQKGYNVTLLDISEGSLTKALSTIEKNLDRMINKERINNKEKSEALDKIYCTTNFQEGVENAELVVEAISENLDLKLKIFKQLDESCKENTILASNTSSISITKIANATNRKNKVIGMHFMNPVPIMKLVEVIRGVDTSNETTEKIMSLARELGKSPVEVNDAPGFVANRILMPMINEAIYTLDQNVSGVQEIDTVMILGMSHPMGPLHLADFIGLDVCLSILEVMHEGFDDEKYAPCQLLIDLVSEGKLGIKTGEGFYNYSKGVKNKEIASRFSK